tara:strand:+ start:5678 stop:6301 length:624 start_codon:yes stop_codon:yes gene_type:complete
MKSTEMLNQIKTLLNIEVKLEEQKLENGTRVESESFEKGKEIFILTDDEKVAMPVGEYLLEDGRLVVVKEEGIIDDVREVSDDVPQKEEEMGDKEYEEEEMKDDGKEADVQDWSGMEKRIKNLEDAIADLKQKVGEKNVTEDLNSTDEIKQELSEEVNEQLKEELSKPAAAPIKHNPEGGNAKKENFRIAPKRRPSTMDIILNQLNK